MKYRVEVSWLTKSELIIDADSMSQAEQKVLEMPGLPAPIEETGYAIDFVEELPSDTLQTPCKEKRKP